MGGKYEELNFISSVKLTFYYNTSGQGQIILKMITTKTSGIINLVSTLLNLYVFCEMKVVAMWTA